MTLDEFYALQTESGRQLLTELASTSLDKDVILPLLERFRKRYLAELVKAAVELAQLRRQAGSKFSRADSMFFTREGLEMASAEPVAAHTAQRYTGLRRAADLCCGLGGDALALAQAAEQVIAVEWDTLTLEMARANARALDLDDRIRFMQADVTEFMPSATLFGPIEAIFIDPSRRNAGHRMSRRPEDYSPPLSWCLALAKAVPCVGIKVSPAITYEALPDDMEVEIISQNGECKEAMLWLGAFRTCARRATVLPAGVTLTEIGPHSEQIGEIGQWVYEPDSAIIRAHLIQRLAGELHLWRIDEEIAYLTGDEEIASPFVTGYRVLEVLPWGLKRLNAALAERKIGQVIIKKRGFPLTPEELRPKLKLKGSGRATLICTRAEGKAVVVMAGTVPSDRR